MSPEHPLVLLALERGYLDPARLAEAKQRAGAADLLQLLARDYLSPDQVQALRMAHQAPGGTVADTQGGASVVATHAARSSGIHTEPGERLVVDTRPDEAPGRGDDAWKPGLVVDGLRLEQQLGAGAMGVVFAAAAVDTGTRFAVKTLDAGSGKRLVTRFQREGEAMAAVDDHPNVGRVRRTGTAFGRHFLVLDLLEGGDLQERLKREGPPPPREACALVAQVARGVAHAHRRGVLHRDLKPANILFDADGVPKVVDFGLAKIEGAEALTQTGALLGTPAFMAPEQAAGDEEVDARTDVYGLGAVLYHVLTGRAPFLGESSAAVVRAVLLQAVERPGALRPGISPAIDAVTLKALAKAREERYQTADALADDLERCARGEAPSVVPRGGPDRLVLALAAAAGLALLLLVVAVVVRGGRGEADGVIPVTSAPPPTTTGPPPRSARAAPTPRLAAELPPGVQLPENYEKIGPGEVRAVDGSTLLWIPGGKFTYGEGRTAGGDRPRRVEISGFLLGAREVTWGQWARFVYDVEGRVLDPPQPVVPWDGVLERWRALGWDPPDVAHGEADLPVTDVTWEEAMTYARWAGGSLPREAEWEWAARSSDDRPYPWGSEPPTDERAVWADAPVFGLRGPAPGGLLPAGASPTGVLDLAGNVREWCQDRFRVLPGPGSPGEVMKDPYDDTQDPGPTTPRAVRGGSFSAPEADLRATTRTMLQASEKRPDVGFRLAWRVREW